MPLYEYVCRRCAREFELLVFWDTTPGCPGCETRDVERVMSVVSVGRSREAAAPAPRPGPSPCGSCGDPRGPGSCATN